MSGEQLPSPPTEDIPDVGPSPEIPPGPPEVGPPPEPQTPLTAP